MGLGNDFLDRAPKTQAIKDKQQNTIRSSQKDLYSKGSDQQSKRKKKNCPMRQGERYINHKYSV